MATPLRLLIIEDNERDAALLLRELRRGGYEPIHERVETPEALSAAMDRGPWDLAVSDFAMPRFNALDALAIVGSRNIDLPVIIVSGTIGEDAAVSALKAGARDFIVKGAPARLLPAVERELREAAARAEGRDVSEKLADANRRFMNAMESISEAFAIYDADDRLVHLNSHFRALFGRDWRSPLLGRTFEDLVREEIAQGLYPEAAGKEEAFLQERLRNHGLAGETFLYKISDGRWLQARDYRMPDSSIFAVRTDVSDLVRRDEALQMSQASLATAQQIAKLGSWEMDLVDAEHLERNPVRWSDEAFRILGYEPGEIAVSNTIFFEFVHPKDRDAYIQTVTRAVAERAPYSAEYRALRKDGREIVFQETATILRDAADRPVRMVGTSQDITERRATEERLRQSQKMEAVGQLTGGVAHDLNNLLTVVIGGAEMLEELLENQQPAAARPLANIMNAVEQAASLTRRLLAFARKQPLEPRNVNINEFVTGMKPLLQRALGEQIDIEMRTDPDLWTAYVDAHQVEAAVLNLAINARDAMAEGGHLMIETGNVSMDEEMAARYVDVTPGDYVSLSVSDDGAGMTPEVLARATEPFFTTKPAGKGTGLGLSMVYGFAKQSGGHMNIYSEVGQGTTVRLYFPRARFATAEAAPARAGRDMVPGGRETILVVEDEAAVRESAVATLTGLGYKVLEAANGRDALALAAGGLAIDLLFTDVVMPGSMSGQVLVQELRKTRPGLRVLYCSGYTENAILQQGRLNGDTGLLQKPYRRLDLAQKVRAILDGTTRPD
jgi:PAS domain S-box-containing protein